MKEKFNFEPALQDGLDTMGFEKPTPVQEQAIPLIMEGKDLIACAQTGTGKTAAFLLPILNSLCRHHVNSTHSLIVVPTRELAMQIDRVLQGFSYFTSASSLTVYGGGDGVTFEKEKKALTSGANIIIATPGRLISHLNMGYVRFDELQCLVLDEADKMLDMGFVDDIMKIVGYLPKERQTLMFSATMPPKIKALAQRILSNPSHINIAPSKPAEKVIQRAYAVHDTRKNKLIEWLLKEHDFKSVLVFCSTRSKAKTLAVQLQRAGMQAGAIHSDLEQKEREEVLRRFHNNHLKVLVATDILSRGIDVENISLVLNYDVPSDPEDYIHRVGRTARAAAEGMAITFISPVDQHKFRRIESFIGRKIEMPALPGGMGPGPAGRHEGGRGRHEGGKKRPHGKGDRHRKDHRR